MCELFKEHALLVSNYSSLPVETIPGMGGGENKKE
jgi:hypothetical protein